MAPRPRAAPCSRFSAPVFVDLLWEDTCSSLVSFCVLIRLLKAFFLNVVVRRYLPELPRCTGAYGAPGFGVGRVALPLLFFAAAGAAVLRWNNSARTLPLAVLFGIGYVPFFVIMEFGPCALRAASSGTDLQLIFAICCFFVELALIAATLTELLRLCVRFRAEIRAGGGKRWDGHDVRHIRALPASAIPPGRAGRARAARTHAARMLRVAPLRHKVAVVLSALVAIALTVVIFVVSLRLKRYINANLADLLAGVSAASGGGGGSPVTSSTTTSSTSSSSSESDAGAAIVEALFAALGGWASSLADFANSLLGVAGPGAACALCVLCVCFKVSFDQIWEDHLRVCARWPLDAEMTNRARLLGGGGSGEDNDITFDDGAARLLAPEAADGAHAMTSGGDLEQQAAASPPAPLVTLLDAPVAPHASRAPAPSAEHADEAKTGKDAAAAPPAYAKPVAGRLPDGTLDIHASFQFTNVTDYLSLFLVNSFMCFVSLTLLFTVLFFLLVFPKTRGWAAGLLFGGPLFKALWKTVRNKLLSCCVVKDNHVYSARGLLWFDFLYSLTFGAFVGLGGAFARFALGVIHLLCKLVLFADPILPHRLSFFDSAYGSYGALMKCRYMSLFDALEEQEQHPAMHPWSKQQPAGGGAGA
jgi:hypothetical protein